MAKCRQQTSSTTQAISMLELCECCLRSVEMYKTVLKSWVPKQLSGAPVTTSGGIRPDLAWLTTSEAAPKTEINRKNKYTKEKVSDAVVSGRQRCWSLQYRIHCKTTTRKHVQLRKQALSLNYECFRMSWAEDSLIRHRRSDAWLRFRCLNCKHMLKDPSFQWKELLYCMTYWNLCNIWYNIIFII